MPHPRLRTLLAAVWLVAPTVALGQAPVPQTPAPLASGKKVVTLWPPGSPTLKNVDQKEVFTMTVGQPQRVQKVVNIHNPSIELYLAPAAKANGTGIILAAGGGNTELNVGTEGTDVAAWLNDLGISAFILRYRLQPYSSAVDALADTERAVRVIRANAAEWGVDRTKLGIMGFSAGGEQAARLALNFDAGDPAAADPGERESSRPDFVVLVYAGWGRLDMSQVPDRASGVSRVRRDRRCVPRAPDGGVLQCPVQCERAGGAAHLRARRPRQRDQATRRHSVRHLAPAFRRVADRPAERPAGECVAMTSTPRPIGRLVVLSTPLFLPCAALVIAQTPAPSTRGPSFDVDVRPILADTCQTCHNSKVMSGGLDITPLLDPGSLATQRAAWERIVGKLHSGEMPPKGAAKPPLDKVTSLLTYVE